MSIARHICAHLRTILLHIDLLERFVVLIVRDVLMQITFIVPLDFKHLEFVCRVQTVNSRSNRVPSMSIEGQRLARQRPSGSAFAGNDISSMSPFAVDRKEALMSDISRLCISYTIS